MSRRDEGFTLIEVLVALALTALVSLVLLHGIRLAAAGLDRHTRVTERLDARLSLDELLRRTLGSAVTEPRAPGGTFAGRPDAVSFLAVAEDSGPGLYRIDLTFDPRRRDRALILRRRLAAPAGDPREATSVIATGVGTFRLAYFGADSGDATPGWHDSWQQLAVLPSMVRVTLETPGDAPRPPLTVRLWNAGNG